MEFQKAPDKPEELMFARIIREDKKIEMSVLVVLFGYRVTASYVGSPTYCLNWCCGAEQSNVEWVYTMMKKILESDVDINDLPIASKVKPLFNDPEFYPWLLKTYAEVGGDVSKDWVSLPDIGIERIKMFNMLEKIQK